MSPTRYPFEVPYPAVASDPDPYIDAVFDSLQSSFLVLPVGIGYVPYMPISPRPTRCSSVTRRALPP